MTALLGTIIIGFAVTAAMGYRVVAFAATAVLIRIAIADYALAIIAIAGQALGWVTGVCQNVIGTIRTLHLRIVTSSVATI